MKIKIEIDDSKDEEIIIRCKKIDKNIEHIQKLLIETSNSKKNELIFYKDNIEYFLDINKILFFETDDNLVTAHTAKDTFQTKYKLYELEDILPNNFMRVSKSSILNINHVYSINRNITSSSIVEFHNTHKQVYVSRMYYKILKEKMKGRNLYEI